MPEASSYLRAGIGKDENDEEGTGAAIPSGAAGCGCPSSTPPSIEACAEDVVRVSYPPFAVELRAVLAGDEAVLTQLDGEWWV